MQTDTKRIIDAVLQDLRALSTEAKKKHNHVKEAAESCVVKVRNISSASADAVLLQNLRSASSELVHPLVVACSTKNARLVQIALSAIQKLVQHRILDEKSAGTIVSELWSLVESECEELRVVQTLTLIVSIELVVGGHVLAKCIVMCFRLRFAKDPTVINAASAAVRQIVASVFERVVQEDGMKSSSFSVAVESTTGTDLLSRVPPPTLRPCAADAYMLFKDLCLLVDGEPPVWLSGLQEMSRTLGLELIETLLHSFPSVFFKHDEFTRLLREIVCPLVIRLFSPNIKNTNLSSLTSTALAQARAIANSTGSADRTNFPLAMRLVRLIVILVNIYHQKLVTECEIFLSQLIRFLDAERTNWQRGIALEALHRILIHPSVCIWLCANYDARSSNAVLRNMLNGVTIFLRQSFKRTHLSSGGDDESETGQSVGLAGFYVNGVWIPFIDELTAKKSFILLESMEKLEPSILPDGYSVSRAFRIVVDASQALMVAYDELTHKKGSALEAAAPSAEGDGETTRKDVQLEVSLLHAMQPPLVSAIVIMLDTSTDETMSESLLTALSTLTLISCRLNIPSARHTHLYALSSASLPSCSGGYVARCMGVPIPEELSIDLDKSVAGSAAAAADHLVYHQVVATGVPLPCSFTPPVLLNQQMILTTKNVQAARVLLTCAETNVPSWGESWEVVMAACAHIAWLLAMRPSLNGGGTFVGRRNDEEVMPSSSNGTSGGGAASGGQSGSVGNTNMVTTAAASTDIPVIAEKLDKIVECTKDLDEVGLHHVIAALCRLSSDALIVSANGRDPSFFGISKLLHVGMANIERFHVIWKPLTAHLIDICSHSHLALRDWAALSLTTLIKAALKTKTTMEEEARQQMVLGPLSALSLIAIPDVRKRQIECLMSILQTHGALFKHSQWATLVKVLADVVQKDQGFTASLINHAYTALRLIVTDFIQVLPVDCVEQLVETDALFGRQQADQNIALSALTQLWTISDFVFRRLPKMGPDAAEKIWLVLYTCLSELCVDSRPAVRKSACQTLLQTVAAHGHALRVPTWSHMVWKIIMPMLDKVKTMTKNASKVREESDLLVHHSRDTQAKQWTETAMQTMQGVVKIYNAQRIGLLKLDDFGLAWSQLLQYLEWGTEEENAELSLACLKCFHELLLGKSGAQTLEINTTAKGVGTPREDACKSDDFVPPLTPDLWLVSWYSWERLAKGLVKERDAPTGKETVYLPGPSHLTTLLHIFPSLFDRVKKALKVEEMGEGGIPLLLEKVVLCSTPSEYSPFVQPSASSSLTPTQEAAIDCMKTIYADECQESSILSPALPSLIRLLLKFASLAVRPSQVKMRIAGKDFGDWARAAVLPFAECAMRMGVEYYAASAAAAAIVRERIVVDVVASLSSPLSLKYECLSESSWKLSANCFISTLKTALPLARNNPDHYISLWKEVADTLNNFLFTKNINVRLSPDERRRDEFIDCQMIDLLRTEILPYSASLPTVFITQVISILNKGSICHMDSTDVLASDSFTERHDLSRACFDALLSMTRETQGGRGLGKAAIVSLVDRCRGVLTAFSGDAKSGGEMRLPRTRVMEVISALNAVNALIERMSLRSDAASSDLYSQLVVLHPSLVDLIPTSHADPEIEKSLIITLKSYQTLLLLKSLPQNVNVSQ
uniref:Protein MON2 homolog n=1 Tax=Pristionchus pacificus TaxID=54126 RepID=A0A8R1YAA6_PRIPA